MAGISLFSAKVMLDYDLTGSTATRPTSWSVGLSLGAPTSVSASELATGSGANRQIVTFGAALTTGTASNANAMTFGPFSAAATVQGLQVWDTSGVTSGNFHWFGNLATARTLGAGDSLVFNAGSLIITLS